MLMDIGKTLAFGIPIFELLKRSPTTYTKNDVGALVIAPTRYDINYRV